MTHRRSVSAVAACVVASLCVAGCLPGSGPSRSSLTTTGTPSVDSAGTVGAEPAVSAVTCPEDVEADLVARHECLELVVPPPTTGQAPARGPLRVFVVRVEPPSAPQGDPLVVLGTDYASRTDYSGTAPVAQRTGSVAYLVDQRGTGHSTPSLACPEADALAEAVGAVRTGDQSMQATVADALRRCRSRLAGQGVDVTQFDAASAAEDVSRLARALGVRRWVVATFGTSSLVALAYARAHPNEIAGLVLDSPELVPRGPDGEGAGLEVTLVAVARACAAQASCRVRYGSTTKAWDAAMGRLRQGPMPVHLGGSTVPVDRDGLVRMVRLALGEPPLGPAVVPALLAELARGRAGPTTRDLAERLVRVAPYCGGVRPKCRVAQPISLGALLTERCRHGGSTLPEAAPWRPSCEAWGGTERSNSSTTSSSNPVTGIPALVLVGRYDPFADPAAVHGDLPAVLPDAVVVVDPAGGHNVLSGDCLRKVRNAWLDGLGTPTASTAPSLSCLTARKVTFL
jgi:pimeloyl-ACP methyl ester carboxylesterase